MDFTNLPFENESFALAIFDPPHIIHGSNKSYMVQKYGKLSKEWRNELKKAFDECMRVLQKNGTLIFKWSETQISLGEILKCFNAVPIIAQRSSKSSHFCVFFKAEIKSY